MKREETEHRLAPMRQLMIMMSGTMGHPWEPPLAGISDELLSAGFARMRADAAYPACIVEVGGVAETAEALGVSEATLRTHLHHIFSKTGTQRQPDLVRLVAGFSSPLKS